MNIHIKTSGGCYDVTVCRGIIKNGNIGKYFSLDRKVLILTDDGVPAKYSRAVSLSCAKPYILTLPQGEQSKNIDTLQAVLKSLVDNGFTRTDCIVAVGGGVIGDLAGFAASIYMRGIDFYNMPTTLLSQVDSSIGGKTAIDYMGLKNIVGSFYQPKAVVIDPDTLLTLPDRQIANGLAEALKMSLTHDKQLFEIFENEDVFENIDEIILRSLKIKASVVEADEKESGLRKVLNFGHTLAHAIESVNNLQNLYHGECVAIGMLPMCDESVRVRLIPVLKKLNLPHSISSLSVDDIINAASHDKKLNGDNISVVYVPEIGSFRFDILPFSQYKSLLTEVLSK